MATFENIRLDKGLYNSPKGFLAELEAIDPSENYKGTSLENLDAFERQLKRFDIKVAGPDSDTIGKFFATSDSAVLFPEYVSRAVRKGIERFNYLDDIIAVKTNVSSLDYRTIESLPSDKERLRNVVEDNKLPETVIRTQERLTALKKHGRMLVTPYEAIRFQRIALFTITLQQLGVRIADAQCAEAIRTLIDLDNNPAERISPTNFTSYLYDVTAIRERLSPFELNQLIVSADMGNLLMHSPENEVFRATLNPCNSRPKVTLYGINYLSSTHCYSSIIGIDKNYALEMVNAGGLQVEVDKLIDRQFERTAITQTVGFAKLVPDAIKIMTF